jgi:hypothetical protein
MTVMSTYGRNYIYVMKRLFIEATILPSPATALLIKLFYTNRLKILIGPQFSGFEQTIEWLSWKSASAKSITPSFSACTPKTFIHLQNLWI